MALAGREDEIGEPLNKYEVGYLREIVRSDEWHEDASQRISDRKRRDYLLKKEKITENEQKELEILMARLSVKPNLAKKAKMENVEKMEKMENAAIRLYPSVRPSVHPSVRPSNKNIDIKSSSSPKSPSSPKPPQGADADEEEGIASKGSDEFKHVDRNYVTTYFKRMRTQGVKFSNPDIEEEFWQYLVMSDFKKGDGMPITKANVHSTFNVWNRNRQKEARQEASALAESQKVSEENKRKKDKAEVMRANSFKFETDF